MTIGIGASTLIFTVADALLLRPLPVSHPETLVELFERYPNIRLQSYFDYPVYDAINQHSSTISAVIGQLDITVPLERDANSERAYVEMVTDNFLSALGVRTTLGRGFEAADDHAAVLSYDGWSRFFGRDTSVIGRPVRLGAHSFQVVGVTPEGFNGTSADTSPDVFVPFRYIQDFSDDSTFDQNRSHLEIIGRLNSGISMEQAREEIDALWQHNRRSNRGTERQTRLELQSVEFGSSIVRQQFRTALLLVLPDAWNWRPPANQQWYCRIS